MLTQAGCIVDQNTTSLGSCTAAVGFRHANAIAISPDGTSAYVTSDDQSLSHSSVTIFDRAANGALTQKAGCAGLIPYVGAVSTCPDTPEIDGANSVTVSPDGTSVYVSAERKQDVATFTRAPDGTLTLLSGDSVEGARSVAVSPDGTSVYVVGARGADGGISTFGRAANGSLTAKGCISDTGRSGLCTDGTELRGAGEVSVSPDGKSVYVASFNSNSVAIFDRAANGVLTQKAGTAGCISDNGSGGACADGVALAGADSVTVSPDGHSVYVAAGFGGLSASSAVSVFDRAADGSLTQKAGTAGCLSDTGSGGACTQAVPLGSVNRVRVSPKGDTVYVTALSNAVVVFDRAADGTLTRKAGKSGCTTEDGTGGQCADGEALKGAFSLAISPDGLSVYVAAPTSDAIVTFARDVTPSVSIGDVTVAEGDSGTKNATLTLTATSASDQTMSVHFATANGTAGEPADYTLASGTATIPIGQTQTTITVPINGDTIDEFDETLTVSLTAPVAVKLADGSGTVTITDDDATPTVSIGDISVAEGNAGSANATLTVTASAVSGRAMSVEFEADDGTATGPADYGLVDGAVTIPVGQTQATIAVPIKGDTIDEPDETFTVTLFAKDNVGIADGTAIVTIVDDDAAPALSITDISISEGDSGQKNATLTITASAASTQVMNVHSATADGTATAPADYTSTSGTPMIAVGQTQTTITVPINGDTVDEPDETFTVSLSSPSSSATIAKGSATVTITDDDLPVSSTPTPTPTTTPTPGTTPTPEPTPPGGAGGDATPPALELAAKTTQPVDGLVVTPSCDEICTIRATGSITAQPRRGRRGKAKRFKVRPASASLAAGTAQKVELRLSKRSLKTLRKLLKSGYTAKAKIVVVSLDAAGNKTTKRVSIKLKR
ncbi:MAG: hypothetical protein QOF76_632 [Solirubrobacteraceae bacterium]|nr:hypothetical protein [Solirubrobacteraceae bacterium]